MRKQIFGKEWGGVLGKVLRGAFGVSPLYTEFWGESST